MFFETIYRWLASFFGGNMADYLSGFLCATEDTEEGYGSNHFLMYGFIALGIALAVVLLYYYVINHPHFNKLRHWLLMLLLVGVSNLFIGAGMTLGDLESGEIGECLINGGNGGVGAVNCWMFGLANFIVSVIFFFIFSVGFKWWSTNCKRVPF